MRRFAALLVVVWAIGCGAAPPPPARVAAPPPRPEPPAVSAEAVIHRAELEAVLDAGLGRFLQRVTTEPDLREGRFVGFRLVELRDPELFAAADVAPGDTVVAVNGQSIERPEHAYTVWTSLRVASELSIEILRGDARRALRFAIVD